MVRLESDKEKWHSWSSRPGAESDAEEVFCFPRVLHALGWDAWPDDQTKHAGAARNVSVDSCCFYFFTHINLTLVTGTNKILRGSKDRKGWNMYFLSVHFTGVRLWALICKKYLWSHFTDWVLTGSNTIVIVSMATAHTRGLVCMADTPYHII